MKTQTQTLSLPSLARRLLTVAALGVGVVSSVATSHIHPMPLMDAAASDPFEASLVPTEHRFKVALHTSSAAAHTLTLSAQNSDDNAAAPPLEIEIVRVDREPVLVTGTAEAWPSTTIDLEPTCDGEVCTLEETFAVRTRLFTEGADIRLISVSATVMASYADETIPASDAVTIELLLDEPAEGDVEGESGDAP